MALFGIGKKKENKKSSGCCGGEYNTETMVKAKAAMETGKAVKVLGSGCAKCNELESNVKKALEHLGMDTSIEHV
ncbi:MAG TPA: thioredoxin family protein, partial [Lachnoclostridium phytofermentans]|nr:thioredoxin family protein [Lachnoclostridium phytofermentans]